MAAKKTTKKVSAKTKKVTVSNGRTVPELLDALKKSSDSTEKRHIRASLRRLGHKGGLNLKRGKKIKKVA